MSKSFVHLHTHSSHSVRDSIARPDDLFAAAAADGQRSLAITDHGNLSGLYVAHRAAQSHDVSLIAGVEAYMAIEDGEPSPRLRRSTVIKAGEDGDSGADAKYTHLTLLAGNEKGLANLMRLNAIANDGDAFWSKPRMDLTALSENSEGIIVLSGCLGGAIKGALARGDKDGAYSATQNLVDIFGVDNFFIEVMSHGIKAEDDLNADLVELAKYHNLRVVATNDSHFTEISDAHAHEAWLCGASNKTLDDPDHWKFSGSGYHLRSTSEMRALFDDEPGFESACDNTLLIAERATGYEMFPKHGLRIPVFAPESELPAAKLLYKKVKAGAQQRYGSPISAEVGQRLRYELDIISGAGLSDYFLIVADMIDWAKSQGIRVGPGRGSAAGSCVSYCMGIIAVDPLKHGLLFERFLNPTRNKMPDIDTDFEQGRRHEVVHYLIERWGKDSVALIGTLGYSLSKNSLRVAGKVLGEAPLGARLAGTVPTLGDGKTPKISLLEKSDFGPGSEYREVASSKAARPIVDVASRFEGVVNTESIHACGVVIGDVPIVGQLPLRSDRRDTSDGGSEGWVSEFDGEALESLGYLKMDVLGLLTLDVVESTVREIERRHGVTIDVDAMSDDGGEQAKNAWAQIGSGKTDGIFQLECVSGKTWVGGRRIASLYQRQQDGDAIETLNSAYFDEGRWHRNKVVRVVKTGRKTVLRLRTETDRYIDVTPGHRLMTKDRGWVEARDLAIGDSVLVDTGAKTLRYRECSDCEIQISPLPGRIPTRCYRCSARFNSNPSKPGVGNKISASMKTAFAEGRTSSWNEGLTKETSSKLAETGHKISQANTGISLVEKVGAERAAELTDFHSRRMSGRGNHMFGKKPPHAKGGYREDIGHYVRSSWEADYARVLKLLEEDYEYEKHSFELVLADGREVTYTPDFYLPSRNLYVEIKGFMRYDDQMKIDAFNLAHPDKRLEVISKTKFAELQMTYQNMVAWECPSLPPRAEWESVTHISELGEEDTYDIQMTAPAHNYTANGFVVHNSGGMQDLARRLRPQSVDEAAVLIALYRPGPIGIGMHDMYANRKNGSEKVSYDIFTKDVAEVEVIKSVMDETLAVMVFQEQLLRIAELVAGFNPPERDNLLRAIGKKIREQMDRSGELFIAGAQSDLDMAGNPKLAFSKRTAENLWEAMKSSGEYSFNKSHSVGYARLSFITAWLKANYPAEFAAGWLARADDKEKRLAFLGSLAEDGVTLRHPDVNASLVDPIVAPDGAILLGLGKIRDVGSVGDDIIKERTANGPFASPLDLASRVKSGEGARKVSITALRALIESGALDSFGPRKGMYDSIEALRKNPNTPVAMAEWGLLERSVRERNRLGVLVGESPLVHFAPQIKTWRSPNAPSVAPIPVHRLPSEGIVRTVGVVTGWEIKKRKTRFAKLTLAGTKSIINCVIWNSTLERVEREGRIPAIGDIIGVDATVQEKTPFRVDVDDGDDGVETTVKELVVSAIWSDQLVEESQNPSHEGFVSYSDQGSIWDLPSTQDRDLVPSSTAAAPEPVSVSAKPRLEMSDTAAAYPSSPSTYPTGADLLDFDNEEGSIDDFDGDDGFDFDPRPSAPTPTSESAIPAISQKRSVQTPAKEVHSAVIARSSGHYFV